MRTRAVKPLDGDLGSDVPLFTVHQQRVVGGQRWQRTARVVAGEVCADHGRQVVGYVCAQESDGPVDKEPVCRLDGCGDRFVRRVGPLGDGLPSPDCDRLTVDGCLMPNQDRCCRHQGAYSWVSRRRVWTLLVDTLPAPDAVTGPPRWSEVQPADYPCPDCGSDAMFCRNLSDPDSRASKPHRDRLRLVAAAWTAAGQPPDGFVPARFRYRRPPDPAELDAALCPVCGAGGTEPCTTPSGRAAKTRHKQRGA